MGILRTKSPSWAGDVQLLPGPGFVGRGGGGPGWLVFAPWLEGTWMDGPALTAPVFRAHPPGGTVHVNTEACVGMLAVTLTREG